MRRPARWRASCAACVSSIVEVGAASAEEEAAESCRDRLRGAMASKQLEKVAPPVYPRDISFRALPEQSGGPPNAPDMVVACASEATRSCARRCAGATKASCLLLLGGFVVHVTASRISNVVPRSAVDGQLMGVHDGMIDQWNGRDLLPDRDGMTRTVPKLRASFRHKTVLVRYCRAYWTRAPFLRAVALPAQEHTGSLGAAAFAKTTH